MAYLDAKLDSDLIDDFEEHISKSHSEDAVQQHRNEVPDTAITLMSQLLDIHSQN